jgi:hypothetical protein
MNEGAGFLVLATNWVIRYWKLQLSYSCSLSPIRQLVQKQREVLYRPSSKSNSLLEIGRSIGINRLVWIELKFVSIEVAQIRSEQDQCLFLSGRIDSSCRSQIADSRQVPILAWSQEDDAWSEMLKALREATHFPRCPEFLST